MPGACLWLGLPWLSLGFSLALTVCGSWALFFVSSWCVGLMRLFLCKGALQWLGASMRAWRFCALAAAESGANVWYQWVRLGPWWLKLLNLLFVLG